MADLNKVELNENELSEVVGGASKVDWSLFASKLVKNPEYYGISGQECKEVVELSKEKNWIEMEIKVIPLIAKSPELAILLKECMV